MIRTFPAWLIAAFLCIALLTQCSAPKTAEQPLIDSTASTPPLFTLLQPTQTGIDFQNTLTEGLNTNILMYEYFYNGGGVATGDVNGDGLEDIYFSANMSANKLYLNKGRLTFQDITQVSGAGGKDNPWKTGVTMLDINGDNRLDIYLSYSGMVRDENRVNQLFINDGNDADQVPHFTERAAEYGLASSGYSNQAYFFDSDRDGDLDVLLLNHNPKSLPVLNEVSTADFLKKDDQQIGVRLLKQNKGKFDDVTNKAGISGSALTYGLGIGIADMNNDGWPDFYISNDYTVPDYLYINNRNGTFTNQLSQSIGHNSHFSMGNDVSDINNDGWQDIITLDMLPEDNHRQKLLLAPDNYAKFDLNVRTGFHYQYMRNMLQLNNGNGTFSEIGQLAGVSNTDWSWAALLADYDNDGWKDLFVTNGYYRDYTNLDFIKYMDDYVKTKGRLNREDVIDIIGHMPASNVMNYIFANHGGVTFVNETKAWGMQRSSNSNGAAYSDLDNDGDLDLIVNNINQHAFVYENTVNKDPGHHYLRIKLEGDGLNTLGIGSRISITAGGKKQHLTQMNARGYLSSVSPVLHFGLGKETMIDTLTIVWPDGRTQIHSAVKADQTLSLSQKEATAQKKKEEAKPTPLFTAITSPIIVQPSPLEINDFKRQPLLINQLSYSGPCMVKGDLNKDGLEDVFVGGGNGVSAQVFFQQRNGKFITRTVDAFVKDKDQVDADAVIVDVNGDGHQDIYVVSGGYHQVQEGDALLQDRLYLNDGKGNFSKKDKALPEMRTSKSTVTVIDVNHDEFPDLFVGGRVVPGRYPETPVSYLLVNDGKGNFSNQIKTWAPSLKKIGMVTDALVTDLNNDSKKELIVVGEWMPVTVFEMAGGGLKDRTSDYFDKNYKGWWNTIEATDLNKDGKTDLILGNMGLNTQFVVSDKEPAEMYFSDFDNNGSVDPFFCYYIQGKSYPYVTRDEMLEQIGALRKRFTTFQSYADVTLTDVFKPEELKNAGHLTANHMATSVFLSSATGQFQLAELPVQAQYSSVNTITILDFDNDGNKDLLLCGNNSKAKLRLGKFDANYGMLLKGDGLGGFSYIYQWRSGFKLNGDVRSVLDINGQLLFGISERKLVAYHLKP